MNGYSNYQNDSNTENGHSNTNDGQSNSGLSMEMLSRNSPVQTTGAIIKGD